MSTTINVECVDQDLIITNSPVVASGGIHENFIAFNFCSKWDGFGKTAVFYRNEKECYSSVVDANGVCEVPHEVTDTEGTMYFGVFGVSDDTTKTSKVLKYKIKKGAMTEALQESTEPTPDVYQQLLSAYGVMEEALDFERQRINNLSKLQEGSTTADAELIDIRIGADGTEYETAGEAVRAQVEAIDSAKIPFPVDENGAVVYGTAGQFLTSNADNTTSWVTVEDAEGGAY